MAQGVGGGHRGRRGRGSPGRRGRRGGGRGRASSEVEKRRHSFSVMDSVCLSLEMKPIRKPITSRKASGVTALLAESADMMSGSKLYTGALPFLANSVKKSRASAVTRGSASTRQSAISATCSASRCASAITTASCAAPCAAPCATPCATPCAAPCAAPCATPCAAPCATPCAAPCAAPCATPCAAPYCTGRHPAHLPLDLDHVVEDEVREHEQRVLSHAQVSVAQLGVHVARPRLEQVGVAHLRHAVTRCGASTRYIARCVTQCIAPCVASSRALPCIVCIVCIASLCHAPPRRRVPRRCWRGSRARARAAAA